MPKYGRQQKDSPNFVSRLPGILFFLQQVLLALAFVH